ncbi:MAG: hypothetical protein HY683_06710 [Chloroflexi bacterium]|nr:hypothetical protein [Chloroflexota bacterium]
MFGAPVCNHLWFVIDDGRARGMAVCFFCGAPRSRGDGPCLLATSVRAQGGLDAPQAASNERRRRLGQGGLSAAGDGTDAGAA